MNKQTNTFTRRAQAGFTLVELIITLVIGAIIMTQAVPSFLTMIQDSRLTTETNKLVADINLARSEAIKRGVNVVVCRSASPGAATPTCSASNDWSTGWLVFSDGNSNGSFVAASGEVLIRIGNAQVSGSSVDFVSTANSLTYTSEGLITSTNVVSIAVCDSRGAGDGNQIQINPTGRPRLITGDTATINCTTPATI